MALGDVLARVRDKQDSHPADRAVAKPLGFHQLLKESLAHEKTKRPLTSRSWIRASKMGYLCPREEVFATQLQEQGGQVTEPQPTDLTITFNHGTATHYMLQNLVFGPLGSDSLRGVWKCIECGRQYGGYAESTIESERLRRIRRGGVPDSATDLDWLEKRNTWLRDSRVPCPKRCECGEEVDVLDGYTPFLFEEKWYSDPHTRLCGSPDGFLEVPWRPTVGLLEAKTIAPHAVWGVKQAPMVNHVKQAHIYMMMAQVTWAAIVYVEKGTQGLAGFTFHEIERDPLIEIEIKAEVAALDSALLRYAETKEITEHKVCNVRSCQRAKDCGFVDQCFGTSRRRSKTPVPT